MESFKWFIKNKNENSGIVLLKEVMGQSDYVEIIQSFAQHTHITVFVLDDFHKFHKIYRKMLQKLEWIIREHGILVQVHGKNTARKDILLSLISGYPVDCELEGMLTEGTLAQFFVDLGYECCEKTDTFYRDNESDNLFLQPGNLVGVYFNWLQEYIHSGYLIDEFSRVYQWRCLSVQNINRNPFLTIVINPMMKYKEAVCELFQALCAQDCQDYEVILVKNHLGQVENQGLEELVKDMPEYLQSKMNLLEVDSAQRITSLNEGIVHAKGEYIVFMNECDLPFPNYVAEFKKMADKNKGAILHSFVVTQRWLIAENKKGELFLNANSSITTEFCKKFHYLKQLNMNYCPIMGLAFPVFACQKYRMHFNEELNNIEDWDFLMRVASICGVVDIPITTCLYRLLENIDTIRTPAERKKFEEDYQYIQNEIKQRPLLASHDYSESIIQVLKNQGDTFDQKNEALSKETEISQVHSKQTYSESFSLLSDDDKSKVMICVSDVSIRFNLSSERLDSVKEYMIKVIKRQVVRDEFWALKGVSFEIKKGESLGLIGLNGSGKSTMLKTIAGVLKPTKGSVKVFGKVAPLIELGAGFDMDLTARENIYLNGALLGYSKEIMDKHYDDIVDFSELSDFMDVPVKNFSSGMVSRLAFAIATIGTPDVLIVDEVLSVGDFRFQEKCEKRIRKMMKKDTTVLFVSHSIEQVVSLCNKIVWLEKGSVKMFGDARKICEEYSKSK